MKGRVQGLIAGVFIGATLTGGGVLAKTGTEMIRAAYNNIKIYVDGVKIDPKGVDGSSTEPFIYNRTTYLPVRAVGEAIGKTVSCDGATQSVYLGEKPGDKQYLVDVCPPYDGQNYKTYFSPKGESLLIGGQKYTNGFKLGYHGGYTLIRLNGQYDRMSFVIGRPDEDNIVDTTVNFFVDEVLVESIEVDGEALPKKYTIALNKGLHLKVMTDADDVGIMDIVLE